MRKLLVIMVVHCLNEKRVVAEDALGSSLAGLDMIFPNDVGLLSRWNIGYLTHTLRTEIWK